MEMGAAGIQRRRNLFCGNPAGRFKDLADNSSGASVSVRILGKLCREISYVAVKYAVERVAWCHQHAAPMTRNARFRGVLITFDFVAQKRGYYPHQGLVG